MKTHHPESTANQIGKATCLFFQDCVSLIEFTGETVSALWHVLPHPRKVRWKDALAGMNRCGTDGVPIVILICLLTGVILAYQCAVQMQKYGADMFLPILVGCTMVRELGPLMVAVIATGRSGSAFAAEIATMKVSEELDALVTMGLSPVRFLVVPKLIAMLLVIPLLTVLGDIAGIAGGLAIGLAEMNMTLENYLRLTREWVAPKYLIEGILKSFVFAWLITIAGCWCGFRTGNDAVAVGQSTTRSVVTGILLVVLADALLGKVFASLYSGLGV